MLIACSFLLLSSISWYGCITVYSLVEEYLDYFIWGGIKNKAVINTSI